jgi:hypothetical protein
VLFISCSVFLIWSTLRFIAYLTKEIGLDTLEAGRIFAFLVSEHILRSSLGMLSQTGWRRYVDVRASRWPFPSCSLLSTGTSRLYLSAVIFGLTAFAIPVVTAAAVGDAVGGELTSAGFGLVTCSSA